MIEARKNMIKFQHLKDGLTVTENIVKKPAHLDLAHLTLQPAVDQCGGKWSKLGR